MSLLATIRGTTAGTGANITYTFNSSVDTTTLQPGQAFDLRTYLYSIGVIRNLNITTRLKVIIPAGVTVGSSDPAKAVITVAGFKSRDRVIIDNRGVIIGAGGISGAGGVNYTVNGSSGGQGGTAIYTQNQLTVINNGYIYGGGGGGGGGGGFFCSICGSVYYSCCDANNCDGCPNYNGSGFGAGNLGGCQNCAGCSYKSGKTTVNGCYKGGCNCSSGNDNGNTYAVFSGIYDNGSIGGTGYGYNNTNTAPGAAPAYAGQGGYGGGAGQNGAAGATVTTAGGAGGAAGYYIIGASLTSFSGSGIMLGGTTG